MLLREATGLSTTHTGLSTLQSLYMPALSVCLYELVVEELGLLNLVVNVSQYCTKIKLVLKFGHAHCRPF